MAELATYLSPMGLIVFSPVVLMALGLVPPRIASTRRATVFEAGVRLIGAALVLYSLLVIVPQFRKVFEDFGTELPMLTDWLITVSDAASSLRGLPLIGAVLVVSIIEVFAFASLHAEESTRPTAAGLSYTVTVLSAALVLGVVAACLPPLIKLLNDLS